MKTGTKPYWEMTTAELRAATRRYDAEMPGLPGKPMSAAGRKLHAQARRRSRNATKSIAILPKRKGLPNTAMKASHPLPTELDAALRANPQARAAFESMPPSHQAEYAQYVGQAKEPATRQRRAAKSMGMILKWRQKPAKN